MTEGAWVLLGVVVGSVGSFIITIYKHYKEEEKEERQFMRKKLEQVYIYLTELLDYEKKLLYDTYKFDYENSVIEAVEYNPRFESYDQLKLLIDLYHQELKEDFRDLSTIIDSIRDIREKYINARLNILLTGFETVHNTDPKYYLENYSKKINEFEEALVTVKDQISNISSNL